MKISVILPTYKPGKYLWECLDSLVGQTLDKRDYEVIIVLNGCSDPWLSEIREYISTKGKDVAFNLIHTGEGGVSNARNIGIEAAEGQYITFVDDDDYISPLYLESMLSHAAPGAVVFADSRAFVDGSDVWKPNYTPHVTYSRCAPAEDQNLLHVRAIFNGPCMKLLPKDLIADVRFDKSLSVGEDDLFIFQCSRRIKRIAYSSPEAVYYRRYREASLTTRPRSAGFWVGHTVKHIGKYAASWAKHPFSYNFIFFASRIMANVKGLFWHLRNRQLSES